MTTQEKVIVDAYEKVKKLALAEIERQARELLRIHQDLEEFVMGMGQWFFTLQGGNIQRKEPRYMEHLADFLWQWDECLKLTSEPMRFTAKGPIISEW